MVGKVMPQNEYYFAEKELYRETIWGTFAKHTNTSTAKVLFFPGKHGLEIPVALSNGFHEENLIACEENKALLVNSEWRKKYPKVKLYGSPLKRTIERIEKHGIKLDALNLDYCSNLSQSIFDDLSTLLKSDILAWPVTIAITMLKGREWCELADLARLLCAQESGSVDRVGIIVRLIKSKGYYVQSILSDEYRSDTKYMSYGILKVANDKWLRGEWRKFFDSHYPDVKTLIGLDGLRCNAKSREEYDSYSEAFTHGRQELKIQKEVYSETLKDWSADLMFFPEYDSVRSYIELDIIPSNRRVDFYKKSLVLW